MYHLIMCVCVCVCACQHIRPKSSSATVDFYLFFFPHIKPPLFQISALRSVARCGNERGLNTARRATPAVLEPLPVRGETTCQLGTTHPAGDCTIVSRSFELLEPFGFVVKNRFTFSLHKKKLKSAGRKWGKLG